MSRQPLTITHPEIASEWHPTLNGDKEPTDYSHGSNQKMWWIGECGHEWDAVISKRTGCRGCPYCSGKRVLKGFNDCETTAPEIIELWDHDKNSEYLLDKLTKGSRKKFWWTCEKGHSWESSVKEITRGSRCKKCSYINQDNRLRGVKRPGHPGRKMYAPVLTNFPELLDFLPGVDPATLNELGVGSSKMLSLTCPVDDRHAWEESINAFYSRAKTPDRKTSLCPVCRYRKIIVGVNDLASTHPHLVSEMVNPELATTVTANSGKKLEWVCDLGHTWEANIAHRANGTGCPYCAGNKVLAGFNDLATVRPDIAAELADPEIGKTVTEHSGKKVEWKCKNNHTWVTTVSSRTDRNRNSQCRYCQGKAVWVGFNDLATVRPDIAAELVDPELGKTVTVSSDKKLMWRCELGHTWEASCARRTNNNAGCPTCDGKKVIVGFNDIGTTNPELARQLTDQSMVTKITSGSKRRVSWTCDLGHTWEVTSSDRQQHKTGCPSCSNRKLLVGFNDMATTHPELAEQLVDQSLATKIVAGAAHKVWWRCEKGHTWEISPAARVNSLSGCPRCSNITSQAENDIASYIKSLLPGVEVIRNNRKVIRPLELDIYIPDKKIAVEFNGLYWHSEDRVDDDYHYNKWKMCRDAGIQLITVWEDDWKKNPDIVKSLISHKLGANDLPRVFARNTTVVTSDGHTAQEFFDQYHIQGGGRGSVYLGLVDGDKIVAMSSWKVNGDTLSLERYATSANVIGGMGKLLKAGVTFARENGCSRIITFADHCVSDGGLYEKLGFRKDKELRPDYRYLVRGSREHKFNYRLKRFRSDPSLDYVENMTERELAQLNGLLRIWDCGKSRYVYDVT